MTTETTTEPSDADLLRQLWRLQVQVLIKELSSGTAKASCLAVARAFLAEENVTLKTLEKIDKPGSGANDAAALATLFDQIPRFDPEFTNKRMD